MSTENPVDPPKIEFPCHGYPIKIIGRNETGFVELVVAVVQRHAPDLKPTTVEVLGSRAGNFVSVRVRIIARSESHLRLIHQDLMATNQVKMVI